jgi:hypothetical protein
MRPVRYRTATRPISRQAQSPDSHEHARSNWRRAAEAARHAASEDTIDTDGEEDIRPEELEAYHKKKQEARRELEMAGKMMDLQYWLEMVDTKHRYGSNLRVYHNEWKKADTHENFFYWLDNGEGRHIELPTVTRERLENEQVRYLSREERQSYLVRVDSEGKLCWAKNGERISTTTQYKDSIEGIVLENSRTPTWSSKEANTRPLTASTEESASTDWDDVEGHHYVNEELQKAKGFRKFTKVSPSVILNQLLIKTVKPNTWIFVADTTFHLYVGIKKSGSFQHSSFLQGARIAAAGLIKIKDGQLRKLSPLSGHYRPPTKNFRLFVQSLRNSGVDMSSVYISRSYAVLYGLEAYVRARNKIKHGVHQVLHGKDKVLHPEEVIKQKEEQMDKSKSAQREREILRLEKEKEKEKEKAEVANKVLPLNGILMDKLSLHIGDNEPTQMTPAEAQTDPKARPQKDPQDIEAAIPPDGKR